MSVSFFAMLGLLASACTGSSSSQEHTPTWEPSDAPPNLIELNTEIASLAARLDRTDARVIPVDQFSGFDAIDDTFDGVHPTDSGELKLASNWANALEPFLESSGDQAEPQVLLLGDSITDNHYRTILWRSLREAGHQFDFVGSQNSYPIRTDVANLADGDTPFDTNHEGHTGWTAKELLNGSEWDPAGGEGLAQWLTGYRPDIVALHIGTNDLIIGDLSPAQIAADIEKVIESLRESNPEVTVLVAQIIPYLPLPEPAS